MAEKRSSRPLVATPRATRGAREEAIAKLQDHYAHDHLAIEEFEAKVEEAERATTERELWALFDGLPSLALPTVASTSEVTVPGRVTTTIQATLGATSRRGHWLMPSRVRVRALLGSVAVDLTQAELTLGESTIDVRAVLGSVVITVPEGLAVSCEGSALLGSFDHVTQSPGNRRDLRRLRIVGIARLGSVEVVVKKSGGVLEDIASTVRGLLNGR